MSWQLGDHVRTEILEKRRAEYGAQIVAAVGRQLEARYGRGFGEGTPGRTVNVQIDSVMGGDVRPADRSPVTTSSCRRGLLW